MSQDNPMLEQLKAEYSSNPHFAAVADAITQELLDLSFEECMNAHPDAVEVTEQLFGSSKRLACNAIFKTYAALHARAFDPALFARADRETKGSQGQVQGFVYSFEGSVRHVVRDLQLPAGSQEIAAFLEDRKACEGSLEAEEGEYLRCHILAMRAIQERQVYIIWLHYLWGITNGHFAEVEEKT